MTSNPEPTTPDSRPPTPDPVIGVIGGMGPYAGLDLVQKMFDETIAGTDQEHLPVALLSFPGRINDRTRYLIESEGPDPAPEIARIALQLDDLGAVVAGMPCNSAHAPYFFDQIQSTLRDAGSRLVLLNMIEETVNHIRSEYASLQRIGVLSTNSIFHLGVYRNALIDAGFTPVLPSKDDQESIVHPAIYDPNYGIKAKSRPVTDRARESLVEVMQDLKNVGAEAFILGCTELPLAIPEPTLLNLPLIDPTRALARALITRTHPEKLKPFSFMYS